MKQKFYAAIINDEKVWKNSSSGGAFSVITNWWFDNKENPVVYGCTLNERLEAEHIRTKSKIERDLLRGSKYIGSNTSGIFKMVEKDLLDGKQVCFSGTPCQVNAIKKYLSVKRVTNENLFTVEVVCHGVGSTRFFHDYLAFYEKKFRSKVKSVSFRAKHQPTAKQDMQIIFENGRIWNSFSTRFDWYYSIFNVKNYILRPSCYKCRYAKEERNADISLADVWNTDDYGKAKSLVVVNSEFGERVFNAVIDECNGVELDKDDVHQPHMHHPCDCPDDYDVFWETYLQKGYLEAQKYIGNNTVKMKLISGFAYLIDMMKLKDLAKRIVSRR